MPARPSVLPGCGLLMDALALGLAALSSANKPAVSGGGIGADGLPTSGDCDVA
jgi:hypothetical protein